MLAALLSCMLFMIYNYFLEQYAAVPIPVAERKSQIRWFNIVISLTHSILSSIGCVFCFYMEPNLTMNIVSGYSMQAYLVSSFSLGYFIHDIFHALKYQKLSTSWEILLHHTVVILCFGISVVSCKFLGYVIVALLCEINSIFLHTRMLMKMSGILPTSVIYRVISLINIATYIIFRMCTLTWMTHWLVLHRAAVQPFIHTVGVIGMMVATIINIILFARILFKDYQIHVGIPALDLHNSAKKL